MDILGDLPLELKKELRRRYNDKLTHIYFLEMHSQNKRNDTLLAGIIVAVGIRNGVAEFAISKNHPNDSFEYKKGRLEVYRKLIRSPFTDINKMRNYPYALHDDDINRIKSTIDWFNQEKKK